MKTAILTLILTLGFIANAMTEDQLGECAIDQNQSTMVVMSLVSEEAKAGIQQAAVRAKLDLRRL